MGTYDGEGTAICVFVAVVLLPGSSALAIEGPATRHGEAVDVLERDPTVGLEVARVRRGPQCALELEFHRGLARAF